MRVVVATHNRLGQVCIETLHAGGAEVAAVYTRPPTLGIADQVDLRGTAEAVDASLRVVDSLNTPAVIAELEQLNPTYLFVVGWSQLVGQAVIDTAAETAIGMHPAPLPRGRGRAPLAWALIKGMDETALTMFELTEAADAGPIITQEPIEIGTDEDVSDVYSKMVETGEQIIQSMMQDMLSARISAKPQDEQLATYWPKRSPCDGLIDWSWGTQRVYDWIRAQTVPYPGAFSFIGDMRITIWGAEIPSQQVMDEAPGTVLFDDNRLEVATFEGSIHLTSVSLDGSTPFPAIDLLEKSMISAGDRFERPGALL